MVGVPGVCSSGKIWSSSLLKRLEMDLTLVKLFISSNTSEVVCKTAGNRVALTFDQIQMNRLTSRLTPTDATVECHQDIFKSDSLRIPKLLFWLSLRAVNCMQIFILKVTRLIRVRLSNYFRRTGETEYAKQKLKQTWRHDLEMPDRMQTKIKCRAVLGSAEDLLLRPGLCACDKTRRGYDFIALESVHKCTFIVRTKKMIYWKWFSTSFVTLEDPALHKLMSCLSFKDLCSPALSGVNALTVLGVLAWWNMLNKNLNKHEDKYLEMPDRMHTKIKRHVVLDCTEDLLLSPQWTWSLR